MRQRLRRIKISSCVYSFADCIFVVNMHDSSEKNTFRKKHLFIVSLGWLQPHNGCCLASTAVEESLDNLFRGHTQHNGWPLVCCIAFDSLIYFVESVLFSFLLAYFVGAYKQLIVKEQSVYVRKAVLVEVSEVFHRAIESVVQGPTYLFRSPEKREFSLRNLDGLFECLLLISPYLLWLFSLVHRLRNTMANFIHPAGEFSSFSFSIEMQILTDFHEKNCFKISYLMKPDIFKVEQCEHRRIFYFLYEHHWLDMCENI